MEKDEKNEKMEEVKARVDNVFETVGDKIGVIGDKINSKLSNGKKETREIIKPLVSSRILFISVLDKLYLIMLILMFLVLTINNFSGNVTSVYYNFWHKVLVQVGIMIFMAIIYFFCNWYYKCAAKTMLCITKNEVYKEKYVPFFRWERTIPLEKISSVQTFDFLWIFRAVVVFQYSGLPIFFWTWTNHEFKNKVTDLITSDSGKVENEFENKNILSKKMLGIMKYAGLLLVAVITVIGIVRLFTYTFSVVKHVPGRYVLNSDNFYLYEDGSCDIYGLIDKSTDSCRWEYDNGAKEVVIDYERRSYSWLHGDSLEKETLRLKYDKKNKSLTKDKDTYIKSEK